jgi:hypothetical protein
MSEMVKLLDKASAVEAVNKLGEGDLHFLNRLIIERLKIIHQMKSSMQMTKFTVGDIVCFHSSGGEIKRGIIHRLNKKTASIITDDKQQWNVAPGLLKHEGKE